MTAFTFVSAGITSRNSGFVVTAEAVQASLRAGLEGADKLNILIKTNLVQKCFKNKEQKLRRMWGSLLNINSAYMTMRRVKSVLKVATPPISMV